MVWFFLWLILSALLLGFLGWTLLIFYRQKRAWRAFATRRKLRYRSDRIMASPTINGTIEGRTISFFIGEHMAVDARSSRKMSAIEVHLLSKLPFEGGIASGGMVPIVQGIRFKDEYRPENPEWSKDYIAAGSSSLALQAYMTPERIAALTALMRIKHGWVTFVFRGDMALLRFDTPDPLDSEEKLSKMAKKMIEVAGLLELKKGEEGVLKAEAQKTPVKKAESVAASVDLSTPIVLQLEEENTSSPPEKNENP